MKKKLVLLALASMMVFQSAYAVNAEETEIETEAAAQDTEDSLELSLDMMTEDLYEGTWINFDGGFDLYLPSDWDVFELTDEDTENGITFSAASTADGLSVVTMKNQMEDGYTLDQLEEELAKVYGDVAYGHINEIPVICFETDSTLGVAFLDMDNYMYNVQVGLTSKDSDLDPILANILYSLSPTMTEEAETEN
ncbi:MAG: hypothetical protein Q4B01_10370 [Eubacteriales bacterium]|nr:hypothetical protein [Eubacteriales bacterium]